MKYFILTVSLKKMNLQICIYWYFGCGEQREFHVNQPTANAKTDQIWPFYKKTKKTKIPAKNHQAGLFKKH